MSKHRRRSLIVASALPSVESAPSSHWLLCDQMRNTKWCCRYITTYVRACDALILPSTAEAQPVAKHVVLFQYLIISHVHILIPGWFQRAYHLQWRAHKQYRQYLGHLVVIQVVCFMHNINMSFPSNISSSQFNSVHLGGISKDNTPFTTHAPWSQISFSICRSCILQIHDKSHYLTHEDRSRMCRLFYVECEGIWQHLVDLSEMMSWLAQAALLYLMVASFSRVKLFILSSYVGTSM